MKPACEHCGRRLTDCKGQSHPNPKGDQIRRVCQGCYDIWRGKKSAASEPSSPAVPPPAKKRKAASDPGQQTNTHDWDPTPAQLAAWKPDPQLTAATAAQEAEWANRTPAQWARRHYLMHDAPRCENCNFPRTGRKGWNEKKQCHTVNDCDSNRWRVLDACC